MRRIRDKKNEVKRGITLMLTVFVAFGLVVPGLSYAEVEVSQAEPQTVSKVSSTVKYEFDSENKLIGTYTTVGDDKYVFDSSLIDGGTSDADAPSSPSMEVEMGAVPPFFPPLIGCHLYCTDRIDSDHCKQIQDYCLQMFPLGTIHGNKEAHKECLGDCGYDTCMERCLS